MKTHLNGMSYNRNDKLIQRIHREIQTRLGFHLKKAILFGSRARAEEVPESDYDILIIVDEISPQIKNTIDEIAGDFLFQYNMVISIFPVTEDYHLKQEVDPFLRNVRNEGIAL